MLSFTLCAELFGVGMFAGLTHGVLTLEPSPS
jgi:hypothetical protein